MTLKAPSMLTAFLNTYRRLRVLVKQAARIEPYVALQATPALEFHGDAYCGWNICHNSLNSNSVVVDVGLGEDISFSTSLIQKYGCLVHGFDPTPRAIRFITANAPPGFVLHEFGLAAQSGVADFYLPNDNTHVSGSLAKAEHVGSTKIQIQLVSLGDLFDRIGHDHIDLLKIDIEGAEYALLADTDFRNWARKISAICIEFHHRWQVFGPGSTAAAVATLNDLGFKCAWRSSLTNEEFLFVRTA